MITNASERRRLSIVRLAILTTVLGAVSFLATGWVLTAVGQGEPEPLDAWVAPYVDVTLTPTLHFESPSASLSPDVVLSFVVADAVDACRPSWGSYYTLEAAGRALDVDRRIVRLRDRGGTPVISFGGALHNELATVCTDADDLAAAYASVIDRYQLTAVDFDIEGPALHDSAANARRAAAIVRLQETHPSLTVWVTLPADPYGLTEQGLSLVEGMLASGVDLAGVNAMTMNFGESRAGMSMREATLASLAAVFQQVGGAYHAAGIELTEAEVWQRIGATPMIGVNDVPGDTFTTGDAKALVELAREVGLGRISFWSANRDVACGVIVDDARVSNTCSGVPQEPQEFATILSGGKRPSTSADTAPTLTPEESADPVLTRDDPLSSPYPLWRSARVYVEGDKVTWQGRVYQAKWWTEGNQPDAPVEHVWDTPWRYLGPVLESDREAVRAARHVVDGQQPPWSAEMTYVAGDEVEYLKQVYRARWWTQGTMPEESPDRPYDHPWEYIGDIEPLAR